jgi:hypothetical protein
MTSSPAHPAGTQPELRLRTPADLVAAVPSLLGFHPTDSLVLVGLADEDGLGLLRFAMRIDLPPPDSPGPVLDNVAEWLVEHVALRHCADVMAVVVGGGPAPPAGAAPPRHDLVDALARACVPAEVELRQAVWTSRIAQGEQWLCYRDSGCSGRLPDPSITPLAAATIASGQVIHADRAALERLVARGDPATLSRRSERLNARIDGFLRDGDGPLAGPRGFELVRRHLAAAAGRLAWSDEEVVDVCLALADPDVRDACFGFAFGRQADAAERLWTALLAEAPDPEAAEPAVLLAGCALVRHDGALFGVALERAQQAWPGHLLSQVMGEALHGGADPEYVVRWLRQVVDCGRAGLELPATEG